jgi:large subunit ribosomal protein L19
VLDYPHFTYHCEVVHLAQFITMNSVLISKLTLSPVDQESRRKLDFRTGDTVRVWVKVLEDAAKQKYRLQAFEGLILARKHGKEPGATFTVRKVASGVGVERIFPLYTPMIDKIEIVKKSTVRRSKLYYVRDKAVRDVRRKMKQTRMGGGSTKDFETKDAPIVEAEAPATGE